MRADGKISAEMQGAFVDGELDAAEWARIAEHSRTDAALRAELCEIRALKELVRGAYASPPAVPARERQARPRRWAAVAALCLASAVAGWLGNSLLQSENRLLAASTSGGRIVVHVDSSRGEALAAALEEVEDALRSGRDGGRAIAVEIIANRTGLDLLRTGASPYPERIAKLHAEYPNLTLIACNQTIERLREKGIEVRLLPGVQVAPSALEAIVRRLQDGWVYVRA
jgi:intracellular sulfur oxidation DsrE/DsrF family protein